MKYDLKPDLKPRIPVMLSDVEIHWLIQRHKAYVTGLLFPKVDRDGNWDEVRILDLTNDWDKVP